MNNSYCIIMAGGVGSRFWPLSRHARPKQFLDILGTGPHFSATNLRPVFQIYSDRKFPGCDQCQIQGNGFGTTSGT